MGPSAIRSLYFLRLCAPEGCEDGAIRFGLLSAAIKQGAKKDWQTSGSALNGWPDILKEVRPLSLRETLPANEKIPAALVATSYFLLLVVLSLFTWGFASITSYNRKLSHGARLEDLVANRERLLSILAYVVLKTFKARDLAS